MSASAVSRFAGALIAGLLFAAALATGRPSPNESREFRDTGALRALPFLYSSAAQRPALERHAPRKPSWQLDTALASEARRSPAANFGAPALPAASESAGASAIRVRGYDATAPPRS